MNVSKIDLVRAIAKLNDLTRQKIIVWTPTTQRNNSSGSYSTTHQGRRLRISELVRTPEDGRYEPYKTARCTLEILDEQGTPAYEFPDVQGIIDLYASARSQQTDVDIEGFIQSLL